MNLFELSPVIPVVAVSDAESGVEIARALVAGGVRAIEVTLRTPAALDAVRAVREAVPDMVVGVGTVLSPEQAGASVAAGGQFLVSPGCTDTLLDGLVETDVPFLAGVATPSEMMRLLERGITSAKLFPAAAVGGLALLRSVAGPLPQMRFCPTGGITPATAPDYLALPNVGCVGGTWLTPEQAVADGDWSAITLLAKQAAGLR